MKFPWFFGKSTRDTSKTPETPRTELDEVLVGFRSLIYDDKSFEHYDPDDLRIKKGNSVYRYMMADEQVKAVLAFKKAAIIARGYMFEIDSEDPEQEKQAEFFHSVIDQMAGSFSEKLKFILSGLQNGFSISEKVYKTIEWDKKPYWGLDDIKLKPWDTFTFMVDQYGSTNALKQSMTIGAEKEVPLEKVVHWVHQPDLDRWYGESDLRAAYRAWWSKDITIKFQNIHLERHGSGLPVITREEGASADPTMKSKLLNILNRLTVRTGIILPRHHKLEMHMPQKTESFENAVAQHDKSIAKALLVPNLLGLSEQGQTGSYSQSQTQFDVFLWVMEDICNSVAECLNEQVFTELSLWNFGKQSFPKFKFEPMTEAQKVELAKAWSDLVQKGAVINSDRDENYLRNLVGFPDKMPPDESGDPDDVADIFLNGAQVTSLIGLIASVGKGEISRDTAIELIVTSFPISRAVAEKILPENTAIGPKAEGEIGGSGSGDTNPDDPNDTEPDEDDEAGGQDPERDKPVDEFSFVASTGGRWMRRVNFKEISRGMDRAEADFSMQIAALMGRARLSIENQIQKIAGERSFGNIELKEFEAIAIPKGIVSKLKKLTRLQLKGVFDENFNRAAIELPKKINSAQIVGMDKTRADRFLASKSIKITDILNNDTLKAVGQVLENGIKYDKTLKDIMIALETETSVTNLLPEVDNAGRVINIPARLENIARTNIADAVNQSRMSLFGRPEFKGFVVAYEYSAIMDQRVSDVCESLDGKIKRDWGEYTPPNHYQCRSILVPVTAIDEWDGNEHNIPASVKPLQGFG